MNAPRPRIPPVALAALLAASLSGPVRAGAVPATPEVEAGMATLRSLSAAYTSVARRVSPAVVFIEVEKRGGTPGPFGGRGPGEGSGDPRDFFERFFRGVPRPPPRSTPRVQGQGSGFLVSPDGYILTNHHVVGDADEVTVHLLDGSRHEAEIVGTDEASDVGVIKIETDRNFPYLQLGNSDLLEVGQWVLAVGNPFGLQHTVTSGIVSALGRDKVGITDYENFIQTDAAINPGNSGGPLIDLDGNVVGINTAIFSRSGGYMGIGFSIPINMARSIYEQLVETGKVTRGYMGIGIQELTPELAQAFGVEVGDGILVGSVEPGSGADEGGVRQGDVILEMNDEPVGEVSAFRNKVALFAPGTRVELDVLRDGEHRNLTLSLGERPGSPALAGRSPDQAEKLGLSVQNLSPSLARRFGYEGREGVLVAEVERGSRAARTGIKAGSLILEVDRKPVRDLDEFRRAMQATAADGQVLLLVLEGRFARYVALDVGG